MAKYAYSLLLASSVLFIQSCATELPSQLTPFGVATGVEGLGIFYNGASRRITILGSNNIRNEATVHLNPAAGGPGLAQSVVVRLTIGENETPQFQFEESFPLTDAFEGPVPNPDDPTPGFAPFIKQHVEEINFDGGDEADNFENNTHIPSVAYGHDGNDRLVGGTGVDELYGHRDNDTLIGRSGDDKIYGGPGDDILSGGDGDDRLYTGSGSDDAEGDNGDDKIVAAGSDGNSFQRNELCGGDGADVIDGDSLDTNEIAGGFGNAVDDGEMDTLIGTSEDLFEYKGEDVIIRNGVHLLSEDFPFDSEIDC